MRLFAPAERHFAEAVGRLAHCNPFLPGRIDCERAALGSEFVPQFADWNVRPEDARNPINLSRILERSQTLLDHALGKITRGGVDWERELPLFEDLLLTVLYHRYRPGLDELIEHSRESQASASAAGKLFRALSSEAEPYLRVGDSWLPLKEQLPHLFAGFFQIRRAFANIFQWIIGISSPAIQLRAAAWESIFTHDMRRYRRVLYDRMADYTTLITGPSGTGKELVAQAIGRSRYIPFDASKGRFVESLAGSFFAINLSALSPTLIESELFGHRRGSFTGAASDRPGWLEVCPPLGAVFLDEIGEVDGSIQVKLLRVLQSRQFTRLGETEPRQFSGKIIAATNRDLGEEMRSGRFRQDFYYRLCSDIIEVPSLRERVADNPSELRHLITYLAQRTVGSEGDKLAEEVVEWIEHKLGPDYDWPGNIRELEQCIRNVLIRRKYVPPAGKRQGESVVQLLFSAIAHGELTADELLRRYCTIVYSITGSYEGTARRLQLDRRTVRAKVDMDLLEQIRGRSLGTEQEV